MLISTPFFHQFCFDFDPKTVWRQPLALTHLSCAKTSFVPTIDKQSVSSRRCRLPNLKTHLALAGMFIRVCLTLPTSEPSNGGAPHRIPPDSRCGQNPTTNTHNCTTSQQVPPAPPKTPKSPSQTSTERDRPEVRTLIPTPPCAGLLGVRDAPEGKRTSPTVDAASRASAAVYRIPHNTVESRRAGTLRRQAKRCRLDLAGQQLGER